MKNLTLAALLALVGALSAITTAAAAPAWTTEKVTTTVTVVVPTQGTHKAPIRNSFPWGTGSGFAKYCPSNFGITDCHTVQLEVTVYFTYNGQAAYSQSIYPQNFCSGGSSCTVTWQGTFNNGAQPPLGYASAGDDVQWHFFGGYTWTSNLRINFDVWGNWQPRTYDNCPGATGCF